VDHSNGQAGDPPATRAQRDMGLEIDESTGNAFPDQGTFHNVDLRMSGRFRNGVAIPRSWKCPCGEDVREEWHGQGFRNCGSIVDGTTPPMNVCSGCVEEAVARMPQLATRVRALGSGLYVPDDPLRCQCGADLRALLSGSSTFVHCGCLDLGPAGRHNLCPQCVRLVREIINARMG